MAEAFEGADELRRAWLSGLAPDPTLTVSEWSDRHRILSSRAASEAGPYRTGRTPYMRAIMDALSPSHPAQRVVFAKSAQVGATEVGNNWIGFCVHRVPSPILAVQPTVDMAKRLSQQRLDPLFEDSPVLRELIAPSRSRDSGNTILLKKFTGGQLILAGANSAVGLRSMPARNVFLDEVDAYPGDVDDEGDPISLAEARTLSYGHRKKLFLASTPTIKGLSRIEREYEASDQQRYHIPCSHCGALQHLVFERLRWEWGKPEQVSELVMTRFGAFNGAVKRNGTLLGNVTSAEVTYSNNLDRIETIRDDGKIDGADPSVAACTGNINVRFADTTLIDQATTGSPCELEFSYSAGPASFVFTVHSVYLPKPKVSLEGPAGVQTSFAWQAAKDAVEGRMVTATLTNDVPAYVNP